MRAAYQTGTLGKVVLGASLAGAVLMKTISSSKGNRYAKLALRQIFRGRGIPKSLFL
jgi:hypothetical protein